MSKRFFNTYGPLLLLVLVLFSCKGKRRFDERITLRQNDAIPYGTKATKELLQPLFPHTSFHFDKKAPGEWKDINVDAGNQAVVLVGKELNADAYELARLLQFIRNGNTVFITAQKFSSEAIDFFGFSYTDFSVNDFLEVTDDSIQVQLEAPSFTKNKVYTYPGRRFESYFQTLDTLRTRVLGRAADGSPDFIQLKAGEGNLFIHISPISFSNYFVLHKSNKEYFEQVMSVVPGTVERLLWNEYYLVKPKRKAQKPDWFTMLMKYPAFRWGLLTAIAALLLYMALGMRRKQRMIPAKEEIKNESIDFVKTLGRLYYDKQDHKNLAAKMAAQFFDHVRGRYKLTATFKEESFLQALHHKSGYETQKIKEILDFIAFIETAPAISEGQLVQFHKQLELFYKST